MAKIPQRLLIIGAGGHGRAVAEAVLLAHSSLKPPAIDYIITAFLDDAAASGQRVWEWPVWGPTSMIADCVGQVDAVLIAIGNNALRSRLHEAVRASGMTLATVIHPDASVSPRAEISKGCALMAGSVVGPDARLGEGCIVNSGAVVDHDCVVEAFGHLGVNASMSGSSILGTGAWMQAGSTLGYGVQVPAGTVLAAGLTIQSQPPKI
ncbi:MAG: acetyltransferase [Alcaligenaceae bacterium]|nr:MAG: acetyltransferase [Alcaligenaceae bacterium]